MNGAGMWIWLPSFWRPSLSLLLLVDIYACAPGLCGSPGAALWFQCNVAKSLTVTRMAHAASAQTHSAELERQTPEPYGPF
jgi:hypothetical protein